MDDYFNMRNKISRVFLRYEITNKYYELHKVLFIGEGARATLPTPLLSIRVGLRPMGFHKPYKIT